MAASSIIETTIKFIVKTFWPWFLKNAWPVIVKHMITLMTRALKKLTEMIAKTVDDRMKTRSADALRKASVADAAAVASSSMAEREKQEAIAAVWREVAEQFRAENETLRAQVAELSSRAKQSIQDDIRSAEPEIGSIEGSPSIAIGGKTSTLPAISYDKGGA